MTFVSNSIHQNQNSSNVEIKTTLSLVFLPPSCFFIPSHYRGSHYNRKHEISVWSSTSSEVWFNVTSRVDDYWHAFVLGLMFWFSYLPSYWFCPLWVHGSTWPLILIIQSITFYKNLLAIYIFQLLKYLYS